jgi:gamma-glutamyltranspeptidase/glutathione hydrolase
MDKLVLRSPGTRLRSRRSNLWRLWRVCACCSRVATRFDAAIATAVAVTVVDPRISSIRGNGFATLYVAKNQRVRALNFYGSAPKRATVNVYQGKDYSHGFLSVPVPSCLKGYEAQHKAYGRLPGSKVLQPTVELAENGFVMTKR